MKHSYTIDCECKRCANEKIRRAVQSLNSPVQPKFRKRVYREKKASRETQHGRYLDAGYQNWDDRGDN